jgi:hypothetical protein
MGDEAAAKACSANRIRRVAKAAVNPPADFNKSRRFIGLSFHEVAVKRLLWLWWLDLIGLEDVLGRSVDH